MSGARLMRNRRLAPTVSQLVENKFFPALKRMRSTLRPTGKALAPVDEEEVLRFCAVLALLDEVSRAGTYATRNSLLFAREYRDEGDLLRAIPAVWIEDLRRLSLLFQTSCPSWLGERVIANPHFPWSRQLGTVDADIIANNALIDVKTVADLQSGRFRRWLLCTVGYALLDRDDDYKLESIGLYFARFGILTKWPLLEVIGASTMRGANLMAVRQKFNEVVGAT